jgi:Family of unknown function (DUF6600)
MRMRPLSTLGAIAAAALLCLGAVGPVRAQDESSPPGRVAQLSYAEGSVSLEPAGTTTWTDAALNRPVTIGDKIWSDRDSRAELDIGDAVVRLGSNTGFSFLNLDDQTAQMQVTAGTVIVHVRTLASGEQDEIDTPNLALTLEQPGTYRVEVSDTGDTTIVKVEDGAAQASGGGQTFSLTAQQSVTFTGTSMLTADYAMLGSPDSLDDWSMRRDEEERQQAAVAQDYVSPEVVGASDLGSYGTWEDTSDYGYAWFPAVAVGWAPYSLGYWAWVSPWGWTWVDQEPWGFAPSHYGRWGYWHRRWCWIPGPRRKRPIYAPALVGWVGDEHAHVPGRVGGHVGWFPLGPHDVYVPGYHASPAYVRNINMANTRITDTAISNAYRGRAGNIRYGNSEVPGAVTAVPRNVFTSAQPVAPHRVILTHGGGVGVHASTAPPAIMPVRQSVLGGNPGRVVRKPPRALVDRPVVARLAPARAPVSFAREQAAIRANGGRPLSMSALARLRPNVPAARVRLAPSPGMAVRERALQQSTLPSERASRNDRPPWVERQSAQYAAPAQRARPQQGAPQERQAPLEWHVPQRQSAPEAPRYAPPTRQKPEERFAPPERQAPMRHFAPPPREAPAPRFTPPPREAPAPRFTPPPREAPAPRFAPPPRESAPHPRAAPERAPPPRPRSAAATLHHLRQPARRLAAAADAAASGDSRAAARARTIPFSR